MFILKWDMCFWNQFVDFYGFGCHSFGVNYILKTQTDVEYTQSMSHSMPKHCIQQVSELKWFKSQKVIGIRNIAETNHSDYLCASIQLFILPGAGSRFQGFQDKIMFWIIFSFKIFFKSLSGLSIVNVLNGQYCIWKTFYVMFMFMWVYFNGYFFQIKFQGNTDF